MTRIAKCQCGELQVKCEGEPQHIFMCYCESCQRRTGTSYNLSAWFPKKDTIIEGETKQYVRIGDEGTKITFHFCPTCGSSVYWDASGDLSELFGLAVGCFVEADFPAPTVSFYGERRHHWLTQPAGFPSFRRGMNSELE